MPLDMTPSDVLRLGKQADQKHVTLLHSPSGDTYTLSTSKKDTVYHTTAESCDCLGFQHKGRCMHIAKVVRS